MKRLSWSFRLFLVSLLSLLSLASLALPQSAAAQDTSNFSFKSFNADYYLDRDAQKVPTMKIDETLVAEFPNFDQNHGILRAIPEKYKNQPLSLKIVSVTDQDGNKYQYTTSHSNGNLVLKIGSASSYVRGEHTYHIIYTVRNPITFYKDHDELYWDVNGTQWPQPFDSVTANIHVPSSLKDQLMDGQLCFNGAQGSTAKNCTISRADDQNGGVLVTTTAAPVSGYSTLTFVMAFKPGTFAVDKAAVRAQQLRFVAAVAAFALPPLLLLLWLSLKWRKSGRDPKGRGTIIPQYTPLAGMDALTSDVVMNEEVRPTAMTALIIELAIRKVIQIQQTDTKKLLGNKTDYTLVALQPADNLPADEQAVYKMIFGSTNAVNTAVNLSKMQTKLADKMAIMKDVPSQLTTAGYFVKDPAKIKRRYAGWGSACSALTIFGLFFFLKPATQNQLYWLLGLMGGLFVSGILLRIFAKLMPARSELGVTTHDYLLGLKMFIGVAEADRIKFLQSPEGVKQYGDPTKPENKVKLFEKLLPYAMIFGIEKDWAKQFADIYKTPPDWYRGNWATFNTIYLVDSLNSFNTVSAASFAPPSSSGSSGFGGGGFAGGGGGGGGGGGW